MSMEREQRTHDIPYFKISLQNTHTHPELCRKIDVTSNCQQPLQRRGQHVCVSRSSFFHFRFAETKTVSDCGIDYVHKHKKKKLEKHQQRQQHTSWRYAIDAYSNDIHHVKWYGSYVEHVWKEKRTICCSLFCCLFCIFCDKNEDDRQRRFAVHDKENNPCEKICKEREKKTTTSKKKATEAAAAVHNWVVFCSIFVRTSFKLHQPDHMLLMLVNCFVREKKHVYFNATLVAFLRAVHFKVVFFFLHRNFVCWPYAQMETNLTMFSMIKIGNREKNGKKWILQQRNK